MFYFLDVDGVLNKKSDWTSPFSVNSLCLMNFSKLIESDNNPHIILSSTWRVGYTNKGIRSARGNNLIVKLEEYGLHIDDSTPVSSKTRQEEIEYYIRRHNIMDYIVLDDDESLFPWPERINLYITDYNTGLTDKDVKILLRKKRCKGR